MKMKTHGKTILTSIKQINSEVASQSSIITRLANIKVLENKNIAQSENSILHWDKERKRGAENYYLGLFAQ